MRIMIHAVPEREENIKAIKAALKDQGFPYDDIFVSVDTIKAGPLPAFIKSAEWLAQRIKDDSEVIWHLQDDVLLSNGFVGRAFYFTNSDLHSPKNRVLCGFASSVDKIHCKGDVEPINAWYSFPCIGISMAILKKFISWYDQNKNNRDIFEWGCAGKNDDLIFHTFLVDQKIRARNIAPNLVDHRDDLCGGSIVSPTRTQPLRSVYWEG